MSTKWLRRFLISMGCALVMGSLTAVITQAQQPQPEIAGDDCQSCHEPITDLWENSSHSHASAKSSFLSAWREAESPPECLACHTTGFDAATGTYETEGVACQVCHPSEPEEHPQKIMYTDTSSRLCGTCHIETFDQMHDSIHDQEGMACVRCHNPHDNGLRAGGVQDACRSCHRDETHFYNFTDHAAEGLLCTDCHMQLAEGEMGEGHGRRLHTFTVGSDACGECHSEEMHYPLADSQASPEADPMIVQAGIMPNFGDADAANLESEPMPTSHLNFIILAAIIGMLFGLIGSPWLEKWYRRHDEEEA